MKKEQTGRGVIGRRVRVTGQRGLFKISEFHDGDEAYTVCRLRPGLGGKCVEYVLARSQFKFVRERWEVKP